LDEITADVIAAGDMLKVISRYGVGVDNVDLKAAKAKGVIVTNTPGANSVSVAELTIGFMLGLARNLTIADAACRKGEWPRLSGTSLEGKTVGILGLGSIGREVAKRLVAFGCKLTAFDPYADKTFAANHRVELTSQDEVLAQADLITLHLPVLAETRGMVNQNFLAKVKKGAFLINTARGELVDETALAEALKSGKLKGAALDAFIKEPPAADNPLLKLPNVMFTPHTGAHTDGATNAMGWGALNDLLAVLRGEKPQYPVA
jgi:D-3-phosphoglycerate dehydrogenase